MHREVPRGLGGPEEMQEMPDLARVTRVVTISIKAGEAMVALANPKATTTVISTVTRRASGATMAVLVTSGRKRRLSRRDLARPLPLLALRRTASSAGSRAISRLIAPTLLFAFYASWRGTWRVSARPGRPWWWPRSST